MPRIPQDYLDCVVFLYRTKEDAKIGAPTGGTGFLVGRAGETASDLKLYVVTNRHVAREACVLRLHRLGQTYFVKVDPGKWIMHRHADDVAAFRLVVEEPSSVPVVPMDAFITAEFIVEFGIRPGIETFMMGRLIGRDGLQQTNPSVRFGHLAMMPDRVLRDDGIMQESFLVDLTSLAGHSGSPVFVYEFPHYFPGDKEFRFFGVRLLGINWGFYRRKEKVWTGPDAKPHDTGLWIDGNTGFACVVPSWKITEVLAEVDEAGSAAQVCVDAEHIADFQV
jgi:hypothetical protein